MPHPGAKEVTMVNPTTDKPKKPAAANRAPKAEPAAKERFARALEEAKAGAQALGKEAQERAKAFVFANEGKARASEAISGLSKLVEDNAATIDEKVGPKYGGYARTAARSMKDAAVKIDAKDLGEMGEDAKEFVRKSPGAAVAIAAAAGFVIARMFKKSGN
jgi:ElaB/YqjD/DUF883 family membrane-anchored ribosome-binding protein